jgi:ribosomal protein S12 methylthiotransferase
MQRRVNRRETEALVARLRQSIPGLVMRTTFIVGFPGESESEFEELHAYIRDARFERAGVFTYSHERDTPAARLEGHLPEELKAERRDRLMQAQQAVAFEWSNAQVGKEMEVLLDGPDPDMPQHFLARGPQDAPDIDAVVRIKGKNLRPGDLVRVKISAADGYDLVGRPLGHGR